MAQERTGAESVRWNLADLYPSTEALERGLKEADDSASAFASRYHGHLADLSASDFAAALAAFEDLHDRLGRAYTFAYLHWSTDTNDPARGALLQKVRESYSKSSQKVIFFELEWTQLGEDRARELLESDELHSYRHYLELQRLRRDHLLSEPEEKILSEKSITGRSAWTRFFDETLGSARFRVDGEELTEQETLAKLHEADRDVRRSAALALTEGLLQHQRALTFVFNTILADKASDDRLRNFENWLSSRNLSNEVADETVEALVATVTSRYDLVARFYRLKQQLLGVDQLLDYDRYAPIGDAQTRYDWSQAREIVLDAYTSFHPRMGAIAKSFFEQSWIDAPVSPGKRGGAFSHGAVPSAHPYILLNYTAKVRDVQTLAHELGHGIHQYLSRSRGVLQSDTPLTTAETASVFGEMLVFQRLLAAETDPGTKLSMLIGKIDDTVATVFRQVAMNRFEDRVHTARRGEGELTSELFGAHWLETQKQMFQGSVKLGEHYKHWWCYIPHFLHTPGYVYAYAFGELLVLALYARYLEDPHTFPARYIELLEAGGSDWPHVLMKRLGVDLTDHAFWNDGTAAIERLIEEAETLSQEVGHAAA